MSKILSIVLGLLGRFVVTIAMPYLIKKLKDDNIKAYIVMKINNNVDLPNINEAQEDKLFGEIYNAIRAYFLGTEE